MHCMYMESHALAIKLCARDVTRGSSSHSLAFATGIVICDPAGNAISSIFCLSTTSAVSVPKLFPECVAKYEHAFELSRYTLRFSRS